MSFEMKNNQKNYFKYFLFYNVLIEKPKVKLLTIKLLSILILHLKQ